MFTGIIESLAEVKEIDPYAEGQDKSLLVEFLSSEFFTKHEFNKGSSVAVNGVCLTVTEIAEKGIRFDVSQESLNKTNLSDVNKGSIVNIETCLQSGDELGGHFVFGHIDTTVKIETLSSMGDFYQLVVEFEEEFKPYIAEKGSVALDGISLTVNEVKSEQFTVRIIPHTYENTTLKRRKSGDELNLEVDMLARYIYNNMKYTETDQENLPLTDI